MSNQVFLRFQICEWPHGPSETLRDVLCPEWHREGGASTTTPQPAPTPAPGPSPSNSGFPWRSVVITGVTSLVSGLLLLLLKDRLRTWIVDLGHWVRHPEEGGRGLVHRAAALVSGWCNTCCLPIRTLAMIVCTGCGASLVFLFGLGARMCNWCRGLCGGAQRPENRDLRPENRGDGEGAQDWWEENWGDLGAGAPLAGEDQELQQQQQQPPLPQQQAAWEEVELLPRGPAILQMQVHHPDE